ncbi:MAG: cation:proton antiporter [Lachnospiraceae bacterium]|nr:cation:proton antiporter [Lachnospiraceae bacterium]
MFALKFYEMIGVDSTVAVEILSVSIMMIVGFLMTRVTKQLSLPNVTAYIVSGILIGPFVFDLIPPSIVEGTGFLPDIALAFIAFSTGEFFRIETLKKNGPRVVVITIFEALLASVLVLFMCRFFLGLSLPFSIVLSALAAATAPASTMMTIRQMHAKGHFVDTLLQVVALDDIVGLLAYSVAISIATAALSAGAVDVGNTLLPLLYNIGSLFLGGAFGALTAVFMNTRHSSDNRLIITVTMLFFFCGLCALFDTSPLLGCMAMGTVYINITDDERLFRQIGYFNPPILMLFFVRSGVSFDLNALFQRNGKIGGHPLIIIGVGYFIFRIIGKYLGAYLGSRVVNADRAVKRYLGLALIPQAGVAIGLSELGARTLGGQAGLALRTIILASSVLYELIGPACGKAALHLSGSYGNEASDTGVLPDEKDEGKASQDALSVRTGDTGSGNGNGLQVQDLSKNRDKGGASVEAIISQIRKIQEDLKEEDESNLKDEEAFSEAAVDYYENAGLEEPGEKKLKKVKEKIKEREKAGEKNKASDKEKYRERSKASDKEKNPDRGKASDKEKISEKETGSGKPAGRKRIRKEEK